MTLEELISFLAGMDDAFKFEITFTAQTNVFICKATGEGRTFEAFGTTPEQMTEHVAAKLGLSNDLTIRDLAFNPSERLAIRANVLARQRYQQAMAVFILRFFECEFCDGSGWFYSDPEFGACSCKAGDKHVYPEQGPSDFL